MITFILIAAASYLLGSIPFGYLLVRIFRGEDVRLSGSGNIGATNVSRKSPLLGIITLALDALKGAAAVALSYLIAEHLGASPPLIEQVALAALFAVIGHIFPVWLVFRGGKGVATSLGAFLLIAPKAVLVSAAIFILIVAVFRYVSLASIIAVAIFPMVAWRIAQSQITPAGLGMIAVTSLLIIAKHQQNIRRLLTGTESRLGAKSV
jgi:acyl phosphate:glycerol-3-phosphate acyltransferase